MIAGQGVVMGDIEPDDQRRRVQDVNVRRPHPGRPSSGSTARTFVAAANRLFDRRCELDGRNYNPQEFAELIEAETGERVSHQWIRQIRTGTKLNVTVAYIDILARFFGVPSAYFFPGFDEQAAKRVEAQLDLLAGMKKAGIRSIAALGAMSPASLSIARLADGVSAETLDAVKILLTNARKAQRLDERQAKPSTEEEPPEA